MQDSYIYLPIELSFDLVRTAVRKLAGNPQVGASLDDVYFGLQVDPFYDWDYSQPRENLSVKIDKALELGRPETKMLQTLFGVSKSRFSQFIYRKELTLWYVNIYEVLSKKKEKEEKERCEKGDVPLKLTLIPDLSNLEFSIGSSVGHVHIRNPFLSGTTTAQEVDRSLRGTWK